MYQHLLYFVVTLLLLSSMSSASPSAELEEFWAKAAATVEEGDFDTYSSLYHPDAVLVTTTAKQKKSTKPIQEALQGWKDGFDQTRSGRQTVQLEFRFSQSICSPTTAHETGIFCYKSHQNDNGGGDEKVTYMHFESLLVKKETKGWLWLMEHQKQLATKEEWDNLAPTNQ